ncbi:MAG: hypothetical protein IGS38_13015 [Synechococcales cyanobacterium M58_A2018_015]|nr:hypothetical protein [Synechococcales cyanobacterium M58_A2018_015]
MCWSAAVPGTFAQGVSPYSTVYYFRKWRDDGSWKRHDHLVQWVRVREDRNPTLSAASLDSQSRSHYSHGAPSRGL